MPLQNQIEKYYQESGRNFEDDVMYHTLDETGIIHISPDHILLARAVSLDSTVPRIVNPAHRFLFSRCNAWHIHLLIGNPAALADSLQHLALRLPYLAFQRGDSRHQHKLRVYPTPKFLSLIHQFKPNLPSWDLSYQK